jgi:hypothetical protein
MIKLPAGCPVLRDDGTNPSGANGLNAERCQDSHERDKAADVTRLVSRSPSPSTLTTAVSPDPFVEIVNLPGDGLHAVTTEDRAVGFARLRSRFDRLTDLSSHGLSRPRYLARLTGL